MTRRNNGIGPAARHGLLAATFIPLAFAACGAADVTVHVALGDDADPAPIDGAEVRLLPYDRDEIFDSLASAAAAAEPQIPADLLAAQEEIAQAQQAWRDAETRWNVLRDTLQKLNKALEPLNPGESLYRTLFNEWQDFEAELNRTERTVDALFGTFTSLQQAVIGRMDSIRVVRADWADLAFEDYDLVRAAKIEASGLEELADTTDANGIADFQEGVAPGMYWVHARHELPYDELYWNVRVTITREEPFVLRLRRDNAEVRPIF